MAFSFEEIADTQSSVNTRIILSVYPTNFLSNRLLMPCRIQAIPPNTKVLGAYCTPDLARLMLLYNLLF
jgi:hypothetical protein